MPSPTQPGVLPIWTQGNTGVRTQPTNGEQFAGFVPNFRPPASWHNWLFGIFSDWIAWLNFLTSPSQLILTATSATTLAFPTSVFMGNPTGGAFAVTFPVASANAGYVCSIKNIHASNNLTVTVQSGDKLEGTTNGTVTIGPGETMKFASDGTAGYWQIA